MVKALKAWHTGNDPLEVTHSPSIRRILQEQTSIDWDNLLVGLPTKLWSSFQQDHYTKQRSRQNGAKWMHQLLPKLLQMGKQQWLHRNHFKHRVGSPDYQAMRRLLNTAIIHQYQMGPRELLPGDKTKPDRNLIQLLQKAATYSPRMVA